MIESITEVTSLDMPELEQYRTLRRSVDHRKEGLFIVEGNKVVERFIRSSFEMKSILLSQSRFERYREHLEQRPEPVDVYLAPERKIASIVGFRYHQGIMALGKVPPPETLESLGDRMKIPATFVAFDELTSAENCGALIRNCAACGVSAVISGPTSTDPFLRRTVRNSMGTIFAIPIIYSDDLPQTLSVLRQRYGFSIIAAHPRPGSRSMHEIDFSGNCCIVFGHEDCGVSAEVLEICDYAAAIPMNDGVDSFNVACAGAILLYEVFRRKTV
jgi:tRNA G18 (ribose-2'-O)-methylase SpoU